MNDLVDLDYVKFQYVKADHLYLPDHPRHAHFKNIEFSDKQWEKIIQKSDKLGINLLFDVFHKDALPFLEQFNCVKGYKITCGDISNTELLKALPVDKKIFLGIAGTPYKLIRTTVALLNSKGIYPTLTHGHQGFPTPVADVNLPRLQRITDKLRGDGLDINSTCYADHTDGFDQLSFAIPFIAMTLGCCYIEKHVTRDLNLPIDVESSFVPSELVSLAEKLKESKKALDVYAEGYSKSELEYVEKFKKRIVLNKDLGKDEIILRDDCSFVRGDIGVNDITRIIGGTCLEDIPKNSFLTESGGGIFICQS